MYNISHILSFTDQENFELKLHNVMICKIKWYNINLKVTFIYETIYILLFVQNFANTKRVPKSLDLDNVTPSSEHKNCGNSQPAAEILAHSSEFEALVELMKPQYKGLDKVQLWGWNEEAYWFQWSQKEFGLPNVASRFESWAIPDPLYKMNQFGGNEVHTRMYRACQFSMCCHTIVNALSSGPTKTLIHHKFVVSRGCCLQLWSVQSLPILALMKC
jgi:hypothetical protein